jgi:hypothetical protein
MEFMNLWYPLQVKKRNKVVGFDFTSDALFEIDRFRRK